MLLKKKVKSLLLATSMREKYAILLFLLQLAYVALEKVEPLLFAIKNCDEKT
jgi:hypothetical protein